MRNNTEKRRRFCPNCNLPRLRETDYCHHCGQKNTDGRLTLGQLLHEFSDATFNVDSRIFQTILALFIPGKLTNEYFKGRHRNYLHPLRIFLVMTLVMIASATFQIKSGDFFSFEEEMEETRKEFHEIEFLTHLDSFRVETKSEFPQKSAQNAIDSLFEKIAGHDKYDTYDSLSILSFADYSDWEVDTKEFCAKDILTLEPDSIVSLYQIKDTFNQYMIRQQVRIIKQGGNFGYYLIGNVSWMVFFMMPFLAFVLKVLYIRRDYLYVEHLIFSFHVHCFSFLMYTIMINFGQYNPGLIIPICWVSIIIYLYLAMKNVYKQGKFKTFIKYFITSFSYMFILGWAIILTAFASAALF